VLVRRPVRYVRAAERLARQPEATAGYHGVTRWQAFDYAVSMVAALGLLERGSPARVHAHFAHDPTLVAQVVSNLSGVPFSFTGHARDLVQISPRALAVRVADACVVITICEMNATLLRGLGPAGDGSKVQVVYNGVDTTAFVPAEAPSSATAATVATVGRFVEKKGFEVLVDAVAHVIRSGVDVHLTMFGDGPRRPDLMRQIADLGLEGHITMAGECTQADLQRLLPTFSMFALTPYVGEDGDRDGLPTVLVEAMSCGLPVVTTDVAGITDLVEHEVNGMVCPPRDAEAIAGALAALLLDEPRRQRFAAAARATVLARFDQTATSEHVARLLTSDAVSGATSAG
jgi:glycosyltransferase involved in cell wall biosynthesis